MGDQDNHQLLHLKLLIMMTTYCNGEVAFRRRLLLFSDTNMNLEGVWKSCRQADFHLFHSQTSACHHVDAALMDQDLQPS